MRKYIVMTLTGTDRIGIVEHVTELLLKYGTNVEASRMAHLGGEFAMLLYVSIPETALSDLDKGIRVLQDEGFQVAMKTTESGPVTTFEGWVPYEVKVSGADHEGIIYNVTHHLAERGINIETMETNLVQAPMSGTPLFTMSAVVVVPPDLSISDIRNNLEGVGDELNMNVELLPYAE
jgi:glycine cleavage system transcriptional repressor